MKKKEDKLLDTEYESERNFNENTKIKEMNEMLEKLIFKVEKLEKIIERIDSSGNIF